MTSRVLALVSEGDVPELHHNELPMSHLMYGVIAFIVFMAMLAFLWSFRNTAPKLSEQHGAEHGTARGTDAERSGH